MTWGVVVVGTGVDPVTSRFSGGAGPPTGIDHQVVPGAKEQLGDHIGTC